MQGAGCRVDQAPASADSQETLPSSSQCLALWSVPGWGLLLHTGEQVDIKILGYLHYHQSHSENTDIFGRLDNISGFKDDFKFRNGEIPADYLRNIETGDFASTISREILRKLFSQSTVYRHFI